MRCTVQEHMKQWLCGLKEAFRVFAQGERSVGKEKRLQVAVGLRWLASRSDSASQGGVPEGADGLADIFFNYDLGQEMRQYESAGLKHLHSQMHLCTRICLCGSKIASQACNPGIRRICLLTPL